MVCNFRGSVFVRQGYPRVIAYLHQMYPFFDPSFRRPANELGILSFGGENNVRLPRPEQTIMVVGATGRLASYPAGLAPLLYQVNLTENDPLHYGGALGTMDLVRDIGDTDFFHQHFPEGHFGMMIMEHIPLRFFLSAPFFRLARFLLAPGGTLRTLGPPGDDHEGAFWPSLRRMVRNQFSLSVLHHARVSPLLTCSPGTVLLFTRLPL